jgi:hypothetical protein
MTPRDNKTDNPMKILRFPIDLTATAFTLELPKGAQIVEAGFDAMRGGTPAVWAFGDTTAETETRAFARVETGAENAFDPSDLRFLGRGVGLGKSKSNPGQMTPRTVFFFEATGAAAEQIIAVSEAMAE